MLQSVVASAPVNTAGLPAHDLFGPTVAEVIGAMLLVIVTGFLVIATFKLVAVTRELARVGSDQWKSNIRPTVRLTLAEGTITSNDMAIFKLHNACAVPVDAVVVTIIPCPFETDGSGTYLSEDVTEAEGRREVIVGSLGERAETTVYHFWEEGQCALRAASRSRATGARPIESVTAGLIVSIAYTHSITGQTFSYVHRYAVSEAGQARLGIRKIGATKPQIVE